MLTRLLNTWVKRGSLTFIDVDGRRHTAGGLGPGPSVVLKLHRRGTLRRLVLDPALRFGEAYVDGDFTFAEGTLRDLLTIAAINLHEADRHPNRIQRIRDWSAAALANLWQINPVNTARRRVSHHYDLTRDLFDLFLDTDRQYSCGYFRRPDDDIETAQTQKKRHIAAKLRLRPGMRVLDIGSGWGGLGLYLARRFDVDVTGVTLSHEQHAVSNQRALQEGLAGRVRFQLMDYREVTGPFDRIVSVGMFEHVGRPHYRQFFDRLVDLLADDGVALLHSIGKSAHPGPVNAWIRRYIFPGTYLPTMSEVFVPVERAGLWVTDLEILRLHYAETLRLWNQRFQANRHLIRALHDERFCRMWDFYLTSCEMGFRHMSLMVFQMQLAKTRDAVPLTRDYMIDDERALGRAESADHHQAA